MAQRIINGEALNTDDAERMFNTVITPTLSATVSSQIGRISGDIGIDLDEAVINAEAQRWSQIYGYDLVRGLTDTTRTVVQRSMETYVSTPGMTRRQLEQNLQPAFGRVRAAAIAVTEVTRAYSQATNVGQSMLEGVGIPMERVWNSSNDEVVCPYCRPLDGLAEEEWSDIQPAGPPRHVGCRCTTTLQFVEREAPQQAYATGSLDRTPDVAGWALELEKGRADIQGRHSIDSTSLSYGELEKEYGGWRIPAQSWAFTSQGSVANALKMRVMQRIGMSSIQGQFFVRQNPSRVYEHSVEELDAMINVGRELIKAMASTKRKKTITLYRGMNLSQEDRQNAKVGEGFEFPQDVLASWTTNKSLAKKFGSVVMKKEVPFENILIDHGLVGYPREYEYIVVNRRIDGRQTAVLDGFY